MRVVVRNICAFIAMCAAVGLPARGIATAEGSAEGSAAVTSVPPSPFWSTSVADGGAGMSDEAVAALFALGLGNGGVESISGSAFLDSDDSGVVAMPPAVAAAGGRAPPDANLSLHDVSLDVLVSGHPLRADAALPNAEPAESDGSAIFGVGSNNFLPGAHDAARRFEVQDAALFSETIGCCCVERGVCSCWATGMSGCGGACGRCASGPGGNGGGVSPAGNLFQLMKAHVQQLNDDGSYGLPAVDPVAAEEAGGEAPEKEAETDDNFFAKLYREHGFVVTAVAGGLGAFAVVGAAAFVVARRCGGAQRAKGRGSANGADAGATGASLAYGDDGGPASWAAAGGSGRQKMGPIPEEPITSVMMPSAPQLNSKALAYV